jgi:hypothetical protein
MRRPRDRRCRQLIEPREGRDERAGIELPTVCVGVMCA